MTSIDGSSSIAAQARAQQRRGRQRGDEAASGEAEHGNTALDWMQGLLAGYNSSMLA